MYADMDMTGCRLLACVLVESGVEFAFLHDHDSVRCDSWGFMCMQACTCVCEGVLALCVCICFCATFIDRRWEMTLASLPGCLCVKRKVKGFPLLYY